MVFVNFYYIHYVKAQSDKNEVLIKATNNLIDVYEKMIDEAVEVNSFKDKKCIESAKNLRSKNSLIPSLDMAYLLDFYFYFGNTTAVNAYDKGDFDASIDRALSVFNRTDNFEDFGAIVTGQDVNYLDEAVSSRLETFYNGLRIILKEGKEIELVEMLEGQSNFGCYFVPDISIKAVKFNYPNLISEIKIKVKITCDCELTDNLYKDLKSIYYEYTATTEGIYTSKALTFGHPSNSKLTIKSLECCPKKNEPEEPATSIPDEESANLIKDTRNIFLTPEEVNEYKEYVVTEWGKEQKEEEPIDEDYGHSDSDIFDYTWAGDGFTITTGLGPTTGDEADFFGFSYSGGIGYYQSLTEDFQVGATASYSRYTGKETDFGFETEGESFIPIMAKARYNVSNAFGVEAGLGYAISASEEGEGGLTYSLGPFWKPLEAVLFAINYVNIAFGEGSLGALMLSGSVSLSKK